MTSNHQANRWRKYEVKAPTLLQFLEQYHRHDRFRGRGEDYAQACIESHRVAVEKQGYTLLSRHDNATGQPVTWFARPERVEPNQLSMFEE
jgi:hypothetical protein